MILTNNILLRKAVWSVVTIVIAPKGNRTAGTEDKSDLLRLPQIIIGDFNPRPNLSVEESCDFIPRERSWLEAHDLGWMHSKNPGEVRGAVSSVNTTKHIYVIVVTSQLANQPRRLVGPPCEEIFKPTRSMEG